MMRMDKVFEGFFLFFSHELNKKVKGCKKKWMEEKKLEKKKKL